MNKKTNILLLVFVVLSITLLIVYKDSKLFNSCNSKNFIDDNVVDCIGNFTLKNDWDLNYFYVVDERFGVEIARLNNQADFYIKDKILFIKNSTLKQDSHVEGSDKIYYINKFIGDRYERVEYKDQGMIPGLIEINLENEDIKYSK